MIQHPKHWILDKTGENILETNWMTWARWFAKPAEETRRKVGHEIIGHDETGEIFVSTVFLGLDHSFREGPPVLWETMVFNGKMHQHQERCAGGREQAEAMHAKVCELVRRAELGTVEIE